MKTTPRFIPTIKTWRLKNGLTVVWNPRKEINSVFADIRIRFGSAYSKNPIIPHFLEHLVLFSSTENLPTRTMVQKYADKIGTKLEGTTWDYYTKYCSSVSPNYTKDLLFLLKEHIFSSKLDKETFIVEKKRIEDEIRNRTGEMLSYSYELSLQFQSKNKPSILTNVLTTPDQARRLTYTSEICTIYNNFYNPANTVLLLSGKHSQENYIKKTIKELFEDVHSNSNFHTPNTLTTELYTGETKIVHNKNTQQYYFTVAFVGKNISLSEEYKLSFCWYALNSENGLIQKIKDTIGIYNVSAAFFPLPSAGLFIFYGSTHRKKDVDFVIDTIKKNFEKKSLIATKEEFQKIKDKMIFNRLIDFEYDDRTLDHIGDYAIKTGIILTPKEQLERIRSLQFSEIKKFSDDLFDTKNLNMMLISPSKN